MAREMTSSSRKRRRLSAGRILSYVYLLSPDARLSDPACDVLGVPLNSPPVTTLLKTRTSAWETRGTRHYPDLSANDNNPNSFQPCQDIMNLTNYLCSLSVIQLKPRFMEGERAQALSTEIFTTLERELISTLDCMKNVKLPLLYIRPWSSGLF